MIKGIIALFTSGAIFNPLVLFGLALGIYCQSSLESEQIKALFLNYNLYLLALLLSFFYTICFKKIYYNGGHRLNLPAMTVMVIWGMIKLIIAALFMLSFIFMISF